MGLVRGRLEEAGLSEGQLNFGGSVEVCGSFGDAPLSDGQVNFAGSAVLGWGGGVSVGVAAKGLGEANGADAATGAGGANRRDDVFASFGFSDEIAVAGWARFT